MSLFFTRKSRFQSAFGRDDDYENEQLPYFCLDRVRRVRRVESVLYRHEKHIGCVNQTWDFPAGSNRVLQDGSRDTWRCAICLVDDLTFDSIHYLCPARCTVR